MSDTVKAVVYSAAPYHIIAWVLLPYETEAMADQSVATEHFWAHHSSMYESVVHPWNQRATANGCTDFHQWHRHVPNGQSTGLLGHPAETFPHLLRHANSPPRCHGFHIPWKLLNRSSLWYRRPHHRICPLAFSGSYCYHVCDWSAQLGSAPPCQLGRYEEATRPR